MRMVPKRHIAWEHCGKAERRRSAVSARRNRMEQGKAHADAGGRALYRRGRLPADLEQGDARSPSPMQAATEYTETDRPESGDLLPACSGRLRGLQREDAANRQPLAERRKPVGLHEQSLSRGGTSHRHGDDADSNRLSEPGNCSAGEYTSG